jgi:hypothetical protein
LTQLLCTGFAGPPLAITGSLSASFSAVRHAESGYVLEQQDARLYNADELDVPQVQSIARIAGVSFSRKRKALTRWTSTHKIDASAKSAKLFAMGFQKIGNAPRSALKPIRPRHLDSRSIDKIGVVGAECVLTEFDAEQAVPTSHCQTERHPAAAGE